MGDAIRQLHVEIVAFVDDHFPGWVKCELRDVSGKVHSFIDKFPVFSLEMLDRESEYPRPGAIRCEIIDRLSDSDGRELVRVSTERPDYIESVEGISEFVVLAAQLIG